MTFPRLRELGIYWRRSPPAHVQLAGLMAGLAGLAGLTGGAAPDAPAETASLQEFIADWQSIGGLIN